MPFLKVIRLSAVQAAVLLVMQTALYAGIALQPAVFARALNGAGWFLLALPALIAVLRTSVSWLEQKTMLRIKYGVLERLRERLLAPDVQNPAQNTVFLTQYAQQLTQSVYILDVLSTAAVLIGFLGLTIWQWKWAALAAIAALIAFTLVSTWFVKKVGDLYQKLLGAERKQVARVQELESQLTQVRAADLAPFGEAYLLDQRQEYARTLRERAWVQVGNQTFNEGFARLFALLLLLMVPADSAATGLTLSLSALVLAQLVQNMVDNYRVLRFTLPVIRKVEQFLNVGEAATPLGSNLRLPDAPVGGVYVETEGELETMLLLASSKESTEVVAREPVILNQSVRENVLCGLPLDETRLHQALYLSALELNPEFSAGPRGSQISGGQRARLALARALYAQPSRIVLNETADSLDHATWNTIIERWTAPGPTPQLIVLSKTVGTIQSLPQAWHYRDGQLKTLPVSNRQAPIAAETSEPATIMSSAPPPPQVQVVRDRSSLSAIFIGFLGPYLVPAIAVVTTCELLLWLSNRAVAASAGWQIYVGWVAALLSATVVKQVLAYVGLSRRVEKLFGGLVVTGLRSGRSEALKRLVSDFFDLQMSFPSYAISLLQTVAGIAIFMAWTMWRQPGSTFLFVVVTVTLFALGLRSYRRLQDKRKNFISARDKTIGLSFESFDMVNQSGATSPRRALVAAQLSHLWADLHRLELSVSLQRQKIVFANQLMALVPFILSGTWLLWAGTQNSTMDLVTVFMSYEISRSLGRLLNDYVSSEQMLFNMSSVLSLSDSQAVSPQLPKIPQARLKDVLHRYEGREDFQFGPLSLTLNPGRSYLVTGATGSGKSTLLRLLQGHLNPSSGSMEVGSSFSIAQALPQFAVSVGDYLRLQNVAANIPDETAGRELKSLKRWERLEIEFLRARRSGANLILLDEVTAGLSADEIERALALVAEMKVSATVVMVSHQAIPDGQFDHRLRFERGQIYVS